MNWIGIVGDKPGAVGVAGVALPRQRIKALLPGPRASPFPPSSVSDGVSVHGLG
jgi:hypothetical protein